MIYYFSSFLRRTILEAFTAKRPNTIIINAPTAIKMFDRELLPVCGRLTSSLAELAPTPVSGSITYVSRTFPKSSVNMISYCPAEIILISAFAAVMPVLL